MNILMNRNEQNQEQRKIYFPMAGKIDFNYLFL